MCLSAGESLEPLSTGRSQNAVSDVFRFRRARVLALSFGRRGLELDTLTLQTPRRAGATVRGGNRVRPRAGNGDVGDLGQLCKAHAGDRHRLGATTGPGRQFDHARKKKKKKKSMVAEMPALLQPFLATCMQVAKALTTSMVIIAIITLQEDEHPQQYRAALSWGARFFFPGFFSWGPCPLPRLARAEHRRGDSDASTSSRKCALSGGRVPAHPHADTDSYASRTSTSTPQDEPIRRL